jgi:DNA-directed RNA polymerase I, II, and III subunit RPABC4
MNSNIPNTNAIPDYSQTATVYICGSKYNLILACGNENELRPKDNIICRECNGRIFYKKRTRKIVQFEAR